MRVQKRDGKLESVSFDKISHRIQRLAEGLEYIEPLFVAQKVIQGVYDKVKTTELDTLAAETAAYMSTVHPNYEVLAARLAVSNLHKETKESFLEVMSNLHSFVNSKNGRSASLIADDVFAIVEQYAAKIQAVLDFKRDFEYSYFGFKTLCRSYLLRLDGEIVERPQHMLMRVSIGIHKDNLEEAFRTYDLMSRKIFTHASPTMFNAGTPKPQCSSCFLLTMESDSIEGIYETLAKCARISKSAGGIGLNVHCIRAAGTYIAGTNGTSNGLTPLLRVYNATARYVDQCFTPETTVWTEFGPKQIQHVIQGERLISDAGMYRNVDKVLEHKYNDRVINVVIKQSLFPVTVTPTHQIQVLRGQNLGADLEVIRNRLDRGYAQTEFIDADELMVGDYVVFPTLDASAMQDDAHFSADDLRFYGILISSGTIGRDTASITLSSSEKDAPCRQYVARYLEHTGFKFAVTEEGAVRYCWDAVASGFKFSVDMLYCQDGLKMVHRPFFRLSKEKMLALVHGVALSAANDGENVVLESTLAVVEGVRFMLAVVGILSTGQVKETDSVHYALRIPRNQLLQALAPTLFAGPHTAQLEHEGKVFSLVTELSESHYSGPVYDFEVAGEHTYVTDAGVAHNGGGKRKGAFAIYIEPWHADIFDVLELKKNTGPEELRARDLFYGLWIPDLFMKRVEQNGQWSLMCPDECPGLFDSYGDEFEKLYEKYERDGKVRRVVSAQSLWFAIIESQIESGTPYMLYKDACNRKSNQKNLGTIRGSNLCTEIVEYTSVDEVAVCNLASVALGSFVRRDSATGVTSYDFQSLYEIVRQMTRNLNKVIDINYYPIPEAKRSNLRHRPIGLGVQGLADAFFMMRFPFESPQAAKLNVGIFETIYFAACTESCELAKRDGPYETYAGSPASQGQLQFDLWGVAPSSGLWDWVALKQKIAAHGLRNSLLVAPMPTASTAQILGNTECFEPISSNIYSRSTLAGSFTVLNNYLVEDLRKLNLWNPEMKNAIINNGGSVQSIPSIPQELKDLYKTVWEIKQRVIIDMAADRGAYIDQSQSLNVHMADPTFAKVTSLHFHAWKRGLKTGMYYLRTRPAADAIRFTVEQKTEPTPTLPSSVARKASFGDLSYKPAPEYSPDAVCTMKEGCISCGS